MRSKDTEFSAVKLPRCLVCGLMMLVCILGDTPKCPISRLLKIISLFCRISELQSRRHPTQTRESLYVFIATKPPHPSTAPIDRTPAECIIDFSCWLS